ncbi:MAG: ABC transporter ATP-binding protein [Gammaproteobacteria bacterium]|nr:ABC transporter ATP-binding protein [Gammaproteobacteria bacterium]
MPVPAIQIEGLQKRFGRVDALRGVDLEVAPGEFFGLLGPNGAGKSTLINILAGLTRASAGAARICGHDVVSDYRRARKALGVVPQEVVFDPFFSVREILRIQAGYFGLKGPETERWREELLAALMLEDKADANMRALSGGMKRRVLIAQALVHRPQVVILDEPTAGVDVELRTSLWVFIRRLHREGHTIVLTTHYLEEAEALCERIAILKQGRIAALDRKQALLRRAVHKTLTVTTAEVMGTVPEGLRDKVRKVADHCVELSLHKGVDSIPGILETLRVAGYTIVDLATEEADLEEVFLELTQGRP